MCAAQDGTSRVDGADLPAACFERTPRRGMGKGRILGGFGAPSTTLGISPAGSDARRAAQLRLALAPTVARARSG
jgi:hypothetical protein